MYICWFLLCVCCTVRRLFIECCFYHISGCTE